MSLENILIYGLVGLSVALALNYLRKGANKEIEINANRDIELNMPKLYQIMGYLSIIFASIFVIPALYVQTVAVLIICASVFLLFGGLGWSCLRWFRNHQLTFNNERIIVRNWSGKSDEISWAEIENIKFNRFSGYLKIFGQKRKLTIHLHLVGLKMFVQKMEEKTKWNARELRLPI